MKLTAFFLSFFFFFSSSLADEVTVTKKYYTSKGIEVEDIVIPNTTLFKYQGRSGYNADTQGCSAIAELYSQLGLEKNLQAIKDVFENWKKLALPLAIYALATQIPYVKEALVSSQFMSDFLAQVGGTSCESAFNFINKVNGVSYQAVSECMRTHADECNKDPDPNKCYLKYCGVHKSWYELVSGKTLSEITSNSTVLKKVSEALGMLNPGTAFDCAMGLPHPVSTDMTKEEFDEDVEELVREKGMSEIEAKTLLLLRATIPKVSISSHGMGIEVPKIDGKVMTITRALRLLQSDMLNDLNQLLAQISETNSTEEIKERVRTFESKYNVKLSADSYFVILKAVSEKLRKDCSVTSETCIVRSEALNRAKEKLVDLLSVKYALSVKEAMTRYIDQVKLYLLQQGGTGLATCSALSGKKLDLSPENIQNLVNQLDVIENRVRDEVDNYLSQKGVSPKDINKLSLEALKLLAKAVDGRDHKEGEVITFVLD